MKLRFLILSITFFLTVNFAIAQKFPEKGILKKLKAEKTEFIYKAKDDLPYPYWKQKY